MKALVLDGGGVVFNEPIPELLQEMASSGDASLEAVTTAYEEMFEGFWSGKISRADFWKQLIEASGSKRDPDHWEEWLINSFDRGPLYFDLFYWSKQCDIFLLSNHRSVWLRPLLSETEAFFHEVIISDELGAAKPGSEIFEYLKEQTREYESVLFVDDRQENIAGAETLGISSLLASDDDLAWREEIISWLEKRGEGARVYRAS